MSPGQMVERDRPKSGSIQIPPSRAPLRHGLPKVKPIGKPDQKQELQVAFWGLRGVPGVTGVPLDAALDAICVRGRL